MEKLLINIGKNVGPFKFGMTRIETGKIYVNYVDEYGSIRPYFNGNDRLQAVAIIPEFARKAYEVEFLGIDLLNNTPHVIFQELLNRTSEKEIRYNNPRIDFLNWNMSIIHPKYIGDENGITFDITFTGVINKTTINLDHLPHESIGDFHFGMLKDEVEHILDDFGLTFRKALQFEYFDGKLVAVYILREEMDIDYEFYYQGVNLLQTTASKTIEKLTEQGLVYEKNTESEQGYSFDFVEEGIDFWRSTVVNDSDLEKTSFKELLPEIQEDEKRFLYFEMIKFYTNKKFNKQLNE